MNNAEILLIGDEPQQREELLLTLLSSGYPSIQVSLISDALKVAAHCKPDLILLDGGSDEKNDLMTLEKMREWYQNPVIVLSASGNEEDIIRALDAGANDYLVKPFRTGELLARIRSALRSIALPADNNPLIQFKGFEIDLSARTVKVNDEILKLTATQYALLTLFGKNEGKVLTHQYLLQEVWGPDFIDQTQYLRVYIGQLRKKIEKNADRPEYIITESGVGYRFVTQCA